MDQINNERRWYRVSDDGMRIDGLTAREVARLPGSALRPTGLFTCVLTALLVAHERRRIAAVAALWDVEDSQARRAITEAHLKAFASAQAAVLHGETFGGRS